MSVMELISTDEAERLSARISGRLEAMADHWVGALPLIREAIERNVYAALGYASHGAYVSDRFGNALSKLGMEMRREVARELNDAGLSTRAIAPVVGISREQVRRDIAAGDTYVSPESPDSAIVVNPSTGEVIDAPTTTEHTVTEKTKVTVGLDGKQYAQKPREPKPVATGQSAELQNAKEMAKALGSALVVFYGTKYENHRKGLIEWWDMGQNEVPPTERELFTPSALRQIALGINQLAVELEAHRA